MTGAIIGDLAACSWENDQEGFHGHRITGKAELSAYGLTLLGLYHTGMGRCPFQTTETELAAFMSRHSSEVYDLPFFLSGVLLVSWKVCTLQKLLSHLPDSLKNDKECFYVRNLIPVLDNLRQGKTKQEAVREVENELIVEKLVGWYPDRDEVRWDLMMTYVSFAWDCFVRGGDFTSAIQNAMQCPADKHLAGFLTGAIAETMYDCRSFLPKNQSPELDAIFNEMRKYEEESMTFLPKDRESVDHK